MQTYIGTKIVLAEPMDQWTAFQAGFARGTITIAKDGTGEAGYRVVYEDGYVSWSPKEVFERCYRPVTEAEARLVKPETDTEG